MSEILAKLFQRAFNRGGVSDGPSPESRVLSQATNVPALSVVGRNSDRLLNREITDLQFIERVVEESANLAHPLFERVRFLSISAEVLDQFYAVRVAKLRRSVSKKDGYMTPDGLTPVQLLTLVMQKASGIMHAQQEAFTRLGGELANHGIQVRGLDELSMSDKEWMRRYFRRHFLHVLTPLSIDEEHPLPFIPSGGSCAILEFRDGYILIAIPANLPRYVALPGDGHRYITSETLIWHCWQDIVPEDELISFGLFQILRDNDLAREERNVDLRAIVESGLRLRNKANVIRLNVADTMSDGAVKYVAEQLGLLTRQEVRTLENRGKPIASSEYISVVAFIGLASMSDVLALSDDFPDLLFKPYRQRDPGHFRKFDNDCFAAIAHRDIAVHWPYDSFDTVVEFLDQASVDPAVIAIKQTLYRTSDESPIVESLITAAKKGKSVLAVIELEARDNEQSNVALARRMEAAGVQIVYGIIGLKIHCKATLIVRMEDDEAITYTHLGTGNYHPGNAKIYTDISFFTRDQVIGYDTHSVFSYLTSEKVLQPKKLLVAPYFLRNRLMELVEREIVHARAGRPAYICIKVNALTDPGITEKFYEASEAGVDIDLVVRRQCCLRPGIPGMSSRITVKSIVGRFLEHSRIYLFANGHPISAETSDVYFGSADLMERNLDARAEILVPVEEPTIRSMLIDGVIHANLKDEAQSWMLGPDNEYHRVSTEGFNAQTFFMEEEDPSKLGAFPSESPVRLLRHV
ncbi:MAG: polyphosphate kinase [Candidatus Azotimanducaceae bacterium]|jgi:polyphosphate kinase